jgi:hypothetical protein
VLAVGEIPLRDCLRFASSGFSISFEDDEEETEEEEEAEGIIFSLSSSEMTIRRFFRG